MAAEGTEIPTAPAVQGTFITLGAYAFDLFASQRHVVHYPSGSYMQWQRPLPQ